MNSDERIYYGNRAKEVLDNEAFQMAFTAIENEVIEQWKNSPARDAEGREKLHQYLMMLGKVKAHLSQTMESGRLTELDIAHKKSMAARVQDGLSSFGKWGT